MKVALIGYGVIGKVHINVINKLNMNLVGICDIDNEKLSIFDKDIIYTDYQKMIDKTTPDIIHICTPHHLHKDMIIYALQKNINVLCEKPICISEEELVEIEKVVKSSKAQLGFCYQNRYEPTILFTKDYLKDKKIISAHGKLMWHRDINYYNRSNWRGIKKYGGGGVLINQAIHTIDLLQWFLGMPKEIIAHIDNISLKGQIEVEDTATILTADNLFSLIATNASSCDYPIKLTLYTQDENIEVSPVDVHINEKEYDCDVLDKIPGAKKTYGGGHFLLIEDFYKCIENNLKFEIDFYEASKSLKIVFAAYRSFGKKVKV